MTSRKRNAAPTVAGGQGKQHRERHRGRGRRRGCAVSFAVVHCRWMLLCKQSVDSTLLRYSKIRASEGEKKKKKIKRQLFFEGSKKFTTSIKSRRHYFERRFKRLCEFKEKRNVTSLEYLRAPLFFFPSRDIFVTGALFSGATRFTETKLNQARSRGNEFQRRQPAPGR